MTALIYFTCAALCLVPFARTLAALMLAEDTFEHLLATFFALILALLWPIALIAYVVYRVAFPPEDTP